MVLIGRPFEAPVRFLPISFKDSGDLCTVWRRER
jgi:hypothetical protein